MTHTRQIAASVKRLLQQAPRSGSAFVDIIAVGGDPASDINELLDFDFVMKEGVVFKRD